MGEEGGKPCVMPCGSALLFPPSHTTRFVLPSCALAVNTRIARTHTYTQLNTTPVANMQHTPQPPSLPILPSSLTMQAVTRATRTAS